LRLEITRSTLNPIMAARPKRASMVRAIKHMGGERFILGLVESGQTLDEIAALLVPLMADDGYDSLDRRTIGAWLNRTPESARALAQAREASAHALADEALKEARAATERNHKSKSVKIKAFQWQASKLNRAVYGDTPMVQIGINADQLMLSALQKPLPPRPQHLVVEGETDADNQGE
jgi:hypothetical protein